MGMCVWAHWCSALCVFAKEMCRVCPRRAWETCAAVCVDKCSVPKWPQLLPHQPEEYLAHLIDYLYKPWIAFIGNLLALPITFMSSELFSGQATKSKIGRSVKLKWICFLSLFKVRIRCRVEVFRQWGRLLQGPWVRGSEAEMWGKDDAWAKSEMGASLLYFGHEFNSCKPEHTQYIYFKNQWYYYIHCIVHISFYKSA